MHSNVLIILALLASAVWANVEKTIFLGPPAASGTLSTALSALHRLTPEINVWHTNLSAAFPWAANHATQSATWILLEGLNPGQRYEVRVCWAATQPTAFDLDTWDLGAVQSVPALAESLASFVIAHPFAGGAQRLPSTTALSSLLLRIVASADYVASDPSLMQPDGVPPVLVDIILDPFLLNVLPRSLVPVVFCILTVATISAASIRPIIRWLRAAAVAPTEKQEKQEKQTKQTKQM